MAATPPLRAPPASRAPDAPPPWYATTVEHALARLETTLEHGLSSGEVRAREREHGPNALVEAKRRGPLRMLLAQFGDVMVLVLLGAAVVAFFLGEAQDVVAILAIVVLNAVLGFVQEYRAERAMAALRAMAAPTARVRRDGCLATIPAAQLVPGDIVLLEAGSIVPADLRLVETAQLRTDESALTGESQPLEKDVAALAEAEAVALGDQRSLAFKGTTVTYGRGVGVTVATGMRTELGRIATLLSTEVEGQTPLQRRLARLGRRLALAALVLCAVIFGVGLLRGEPPVLMLLTALSLAVAAIPESLPAVVTVSLALGARRMARARALVRRLPAVETLGSVTYICSDKTGTLTENRMRVEALRVGGADVAPEAAPRRLVLALALSNDAEPGRDGAAEGDPTEVALHEAARRAGADKRALAARWPRVGEIPFSSERARMTTLHQGEDGGVLAFTKGAPERVLAGCGDRLTRDGRGPLDTDAALAEAAALARAGLRVLAVATRELDVLPGDAAEVERAQTLLGFVGLMDPPRPEAAEAVALCRSAGITPVMITGDHPETARAIAVRLGIAAAGDRAVTGVELARTSDEALTRMVRATRVYARVAPEDKLRIVKALQADGELVAVTGDGVNDAPALRRADIGVAMGRGGTDVAREAAHMILLDDDFATIVGAVREGRRIYDDIRKFVRYVLTGNAGEIWALFLAPLLGLPIPLLPIHILWVNLVTDGLPGLALAAEPAERDVMARPPRPPRESFFAHGLWQHAVWVGLLIGGLTLATQGWAYETGHAHWRSMTFTVLTLTQMAHVLAIRSERESLLRIGLLTNRPLVAAVLLTFGLQMATLYTAIGRRIFGTAALSAGELLLCLAASVVVLVAVEIEKWLVRRGLLYREAPAA